MLSLSRDVILLAQNSLLCMTGFTQSENLVVITCNKVRMQVTLCWRGCFQAISPKLATISRARIQYHDNKNKISMYLVPDI